MYTFSYSEFYDYYTNPDNLITGKDTERFTKIKKSTLSYLKRIQ